MAEALEGICGRRVRGREAGQGKEARFRGIKWSKLPVLSKLAQEPVGHTPLPWKVAHT